MDTTYLGRYYYKTHRIKINWELIQKQFPEMWIRMGLVCIIHECAHWWNDVIAHKRGARGGLLGYYEDELCANKAQRFVEKLLRLPDEWGSAELKTEVALAARISRYYGTGRTWRKTLIKNA